MVSFFLCLSINLRAKKTTRDHCIIRHSLRYYRHSGLVIYTSKLPAPSVSMPCDYRILQSPPKGQVLLVLWETVGRFPIRVLISVLTRKHFSEYIVLVSVSART